MKKTAEQHMQAIDEWVEEARGDHPDLGDCDLYGDIVPSYIAAEVGTNTPMAQEILRRHGRD